MKDISSPPGAYRFRSFFVIIFISICLLIFFHYTEKWDNGFEEVSVQRVITNINSALAITTYQYIIEGRADKLNELDGQNPFKFLAMHGNLPINYYGEKSIENSNVVGGWYFDLDSGRTHYRYNHKETDRKFLLKLFYDDVNLNNRFEKTIDRNYYLKLQELK